MDYQSYSPQGQRISRTMSCSRAGVTWSRRRRGGQAFVETALVSTVLLIMIFMVAQVASVISTMNVINQISREGARIAAKNADEYGYCGACTAASFQTEVISLMDSQVFTNPSGGFNEPIPASKCTITVTEPGATVPVQGQPVTVSVSYNIGAQLFVPYSAAALKYLPGYNSYDKTYTFTTTMTME